MNEKSTGHTILASFSRKEWDEAKDAMNYLLKQKDNVKNAIYQKISKIHQKILSKDVTFVNESDHGTDNVTIDIVTENEMDTIMNEIDNETKNDNENPNANDKQREV